MNIIRYGYKVRCKLKHKFMIFKHLQLQTTDLLVCRMTNSWTRTLENVNNRDRCPRKELECHLVADFMKK